MGGAGGRLGKRAQSRFGGSGKRGWWSGGLQRHLERTAWAGPPQLWVSEA